MELSAPIDQKISCFLPGKFICWKAKYRFEVQGLAKEKFYETAGQ